MAGGVRCAFDVMLCLPGACVQPFPAPSKEMLSCLAVPSFCAQAALYPTIFLLVMTWHCKLHLFLLLWVFPHSLGAGLPPVLRYLFWFSGWQILNPSCWGKRLIQQQTAFLWSIHECSLLLYDPFHIAKAVVQSLLAFKGDRCPSLTWEDCPRDRTWFLGFPGCCRGCSEPLEPMSTLYLPRAGTHWCRANFCFGVATCVSCGSSSTGKRGQRRKSQRFNTLQGLLQRALQILGKWRCFRLEIFTFWE